MKNNIKKISVLLVVVLGLLARLVPHPPNFVPINAIGLFSGSKFNKITAVIVPLLIMLISDVFLGFHKTMIFVYFSLVLVTLLGLRIGKFNNKKLFAYSITSSFIFFMITNFGVWLMFDMYPRTINGLINCYAMAIPFFGNSIMGDLFYTYLVFYGFSFVENKLINKINSLETQYL